MLVSSANDTSSNKPLRNCGMRTRIYSVYEVAYVAYEVPYVRTCAECLAESISYYAAYEEAYVAYEVAYVAYAPVLSAWRGPFRTAAFRPHSAVPQMHRMSVPI